MRLRRRERGREREGGKEEGGKEGGREGRREEGIQGREEVSAVSVNGDQSRPTSTWIVKMQCEREE